MGSLSTSMLQGLALSIVPTSHSHKPKDLTLTRLASLVTWVREAIPVNRHNTEANNVSITSRLTRGLETLLVMSDMEQVVMFVLLCRALGYNTRLVINCNTVSLKPSNDNSDNQGKVMEVEDEKDTGPSTSKSPIAGSGGDKDKSKAKKKKKSSVAHGSDSEGETVSRKVAKDSKSKLSSKLAAAVKARTSSRMSAASASKDIEEEIIKKLEKNPTKQPKSADSKSSVKEVKENKKESKSSTKSKPKQSVPSNNHWAEVYLEKGRKWI